jgi:hypothetical protein
LLLSYFVLVCRIVPVARPALAMNQWIQIIPAKDVRQEHGGAIRTPVSPFGLQPLDPKDPGNQPPGYLDASRQAGGTQEARREAGKAARQESLQPYHPVAQGEGEKFEVEVSQNRDWSPGQ